MVARAKRPKRISSQPLKWHGGKSPLASWLHSLAPPSVMEDQENGYTHRNIAYAGGLGEFWNWLPTAGISEAVNDSNHKLTNLYDVLRSPEHYVEFARTVELMPFSDESFYLTAYPARFHNTDCISAACAFFVEYRQSRQGLGKDYATPTTRTRRGMNENVSAWLSAVDGLSECHERLRRVEIRNMDAIDFIEAYDHKRALFYLDPPYLHGTRSSTGEYGPNEMTDDDHAVLLGRLSAMKGRFMLSGYRNEMYDYAAKLHVWDRHDKIRPNSASSSKTKEDRTECVWTNY